MPITLVKTDSGELLKFQSDVNLESSGDAVEGKVQAFMKICICNDKLENLSQPTVHELLQTEEEFHTDLRKKAAGQGKLITSHSTDPEWNPQGYAKNLEDEK